MNAGAAVSQHTQNVPLWLNTALLRKSRTTIQSRTNTSQNFKISPLDFNSAPVSKVALENIALCVSKSQLVQDAVQQAATNMTRSGPSAPTVERTGVKFAQKFNPTTANVLTKMKVQMKKEVKTYEEQTNSATENMKNITNLILINLSIPQNSVSESE